VLHWFNIEPVRAQFKEGIMRTLIVFLLIVVAVTLANGQWYWQNPLPDGLSRSSVYAIDSLTAVAVGSTVIRTSDGGQTWSNQVRGITGNLSSVHFIDSHDGWAVGDSGAMFRTTNAGLDWTLQLTGTTANLTSIEFASENFGWVAGKGVILHSIDRGLSWNAQTSKPNVSYRSLCFVDSSYGWVVEDSSFTARILKTTDGGTHWSVQSSRRNMYALQFLNRSNGWLIQGVSIRHTTNGGIDWFTVLEVDSMLSPWLNSLYFSDHNNGCVVGPGYLKISPMMSPRLFSPGWECGVVLQTTDGGIHWTIDTLETVPALLAVHCTPNGYGWALGGSGAILHTTNGGHEWTEQSRSATYYPVSTIWFVDRNNGWIGSGYIELGGGMGGSINRTTDGGATWARQWVEQPQHDGNPVISINFVDLMNGWALTFGQILHTTDGGNSWGVQRDRGPNYQGAVYFVDQNNGWVAGDSVLHTTNGGARWISRPFPRYGSSVFFLDLNNGWIAGRDGIYHTTNQGSSWVQQHTWNVPYPYFASIHFVNANQGWVVNYNGDIVHTTNGGDQWLPQSTGVSAELRSVYFTDVDNGYAVGWKPSSHSPIVLRTTNGGSEWIQQQTPASEYLYSYYSVHFVDQNTGWIGGDGGTILHTTNGGVTFVEGQRRNEVPTQFILEQNYPNPFNPSTTISYQLPTQSHVTLKVYNLLGQEAGTLVNEVKQPGTYTVQWDASDVASGVYLYRLTSGAFVETKKCLLLK
jgi:photosystem II stability/assembly factor-like uncharacterized protein